LGAYVVGTLVGTIGYAIAGREWKHWKLGRIGDDIKFVAKLLVAKPGTSCGNTQAPDNESNGETATNHKWDTALQSYMYDYIPHIDADAGMRLAKLSAERHMCRVFMTGCSTLFVIKICLLLPPLFFSPDGVVLSVLAAIVLLSFLFYKHLAIRSRQLLVNNWHRIRSNEDLEGRADEKVTDPGE